MDESLVRSCRLRGSPCHYQPGGAPAGRRRRVRHSENERDRVTSSRSKPGSVDAYIAGFEPEVQAVLQKVREVVHAAAPQAVEVISYQMPALKLNGILVYFAAFKQHIGFYPPIRGDAK